jgi:hypothetical protein
MMINLDAASRSTLFNYIIVYFIHRILVEFGEILQNKESVERGIGVFFPATVFLLIEAGVLEKGGGLRVSGKIKEMIDSIYAQRAKGNPTLVTTTKTKLMLKGVKVDNYTSQSPDDPVIIEKLKNIAKEMNINL